MQCDYQLQSVFGVVYTGGNLCFSPDGESILSPVGNHICMHNVVQAENSTVPCVNSTIQAFDISADGDLLFAVGQRGVGVFYSISGRVQLDNITFPPHCDIRCVKISPCSKFLAVGLEETLQIFNTPSQRTVSFHGCTRLENLHNLLMRPIRTIDWAPDSSALLVSGDDSRMKIVPRDTRNKARHQKMENTLSGHSSGVIGGYFMEEEKHLVSVGANNVILQWERSGLTRNEFGLIVRNGRLAARAQALVGGKRGRQGKASKKDGESGDDDDDDANEEEDYSDSDLDLSSDADESKPIFMEREKAKDVLQRLQSEVHTKEESHLSDSLKYVWEIKKRHMLHHQGKVNVSSFNKRRSLLALGYTTGMFALYAVDGVVDATLIHVLSMSSHSLTACSISPAGDWIAFGSDHLRQLLVWDWKGESYVMKEQSHYYDISSVAYVPDASLIITGSEDSKVKIWKAATGQCFSTFVEHEGAISALAASSTNALYSASKDGTIRGYDLVRFRQFRIFNPPQPAQFTCLAVDPSGELIAAGSLLSTEVLVWSTQTGRLVERFDAHSAPVTCLSFHPAGTALVSGSQDKSIIVWDIFTTGNEGERIRGDGEIIATTFEVVHVTFSSTGNRMAVLLSNHEIIVYDTSSPLSPEIIRTFSTKPDVAGGWMDGLGPNSKNTNNRFTTICLSPDGEKILAAGETRWICMYHAVQGFLLKKWPVSSNKDIEGVEEQFDYKNQSEAGPLDAINVEDDDVNVKKRKTLQIPGSRNRHFASGKRTTKIRARTMQAIFAANGREYCVATTDGLKIFSLDAGSRIKFTPLQLTADITPASIHRLIGQEKYGLGLVGALLLSDTALGKLALRKTPASHIPVIVPTIPSAVFPLLMTWVAQEIGASKNIEHSLRWGAGLITHTTEPLEGAKRRHNVAPHLKGLLKAVLAHGSLMKTMHGNTHALKYIARSAPLLLKSREEQIDNVEE